jgi:hypothetical protein
VVEIDAHFDVSSLPNQPDEAVIERALIEIRQRFYAEK